MTPIRPTKAHPAKIAFHRSEMSPILDVYGRLVQATLARDYAIGMYADRAIFAIFRRASEQPTWRIEKVPALAQRQGAFAVYGAAGQVLKRGHQLRSVLGVFDARKFQIISGD